jgi:DNA replication protein DnaC
MTTENYKATLRRFVDRVYAASKNKAADRGELKEIAASGYDLLEMFPEPEERDEETGADADASHVALLSEFIDERVRSIVEKYTSTPQQGNDLPSVVPERYRHCDFENFDTEIAWESKAGVEWNADLGKAKLIVQAFARDFPIGEHQQGLLLIGPCGTGKTHLASSAATLIASKGFDTCFYDYRELLSISRFHLRDMARALEVDFLVLDDVGSSRPSISGIEVLHSILNRRCARQLSTVITTNYGDARGVAISSLQQTLTDRIGMRNRSLLREMCRLVEILSPDYRGIIWPEELPS